ncbi:ADP-heptose--lipooligosaccharide heptosyltransferase II [uncultured Gammaproteobacteria bacterium]|nr:ADP-heptose--lipooligosaccharide heptosyltransferase II [uncultured Gammaproteobacteria bacterium]
MNILSTSHDKVGDFITKMPLFFTIKRHYPQAKVFALVSKVNFELAEQVDFIDEVILYDTNHFLQTLNAVKKANIEISISAFIDTQLGWILLLSRIKTRIAPATKLAQVLFNKTLKQRRSQVEKTEVLYNLDLAKILDKDINLSFKPPLLTLTKNNHFRNKHQLGNKKIVLFHPGYGGSSDGNLTLENYIELANTVREQNNTQVVWTFGPDDLNTKNQLQVLNSKEDLIYQPPTLLDFCHLINDSKLLISTSTGPMHLAGALNIETISFFGDSLFASPKRWATVNDLNKQHNFIFDTHFKLVDAVYVIREVLC